MTADEQHSNNARTDDKTTTVAGQDDTTQHTGAEGNTSQTRAEHASEQDGNPPSFTPKDSTRTRPPAQGAHTTASRTGTVKRHRPWWQITVLVVFVVCAVVAALYANGTIWGTPRAQAMSACRTATAQAQDTVGEFQLLEQTLHVSNHLLVALGRMLGSVYAYNLNL